MTNYFKAVTLFCLFCATPIAAQVPDIEVLKAQLERLKLQNDIQKEKIQSNLLELQQEKNKVQLMNELQIEKHRHDLAQLEAQTKKLVIENKRLDEEKKKMLAKLKTKRDQLVMQNAIQAEKNKQEELKMKLVKAKLDFEKAQVALKKSKLGFELSKLTTEISKRKNKQILANQVNKPKEYLKKPFVNGRLILSDRKIKLSTVIVSGTAKHVNERIHYYNNKSTEYPIFLVIDRCYGGSVMEGAKILKAIEGSRAPVYVVVKTFAASMAAIITTLAEHSYAYPNAIILHHQISNIATGNQRQIAENLELTDKWSQRILYPVAEKMGLNMADFVEKMYDKNSTGDWQEFADVAIKLKWVNKIVKYIVDLSVIKHPAMVDKEENRLMLSAMTDEKMDPQGRRYVELPLLSPMDVYYLYNPGNYYR